MRNITAQQLKDVMDKHEVTVINVLKPESFQQQHIPASQNIPGDWPDFERRVEEAVSGKDAPIAVYCASKECDASIKAARRLEAAGFTNIHEFEGGMKEWSDAGFDVEGAGAGGEQRQAA